MRRVILILGGFLCGGLIGAAAGLLLAPRSGPDTQDYLRSQLDQIRKEAMEAYDARRKELMEEYENAKKGINIPAK